MLDMREAASRTFWTAGSRRPMRMAMIAITTSSSISVKPRRVPVAARGRKGSGVRTMRPLQQSGGTKKKRNLAAHDRADFEAQLGPGVVLGREGFLAPFAPGDADAVDAQVAARQVGALDAGPDLA